MDWTSTPTFCTPNLLVNPPFSPNVKIYYKNWSTTSLVSNLLFPTFNKTRPKCTPLPTLFKLLSFNTTQLRALKGGSNSHPTISCNISKWWYFATLRNTIRFFRKSVGEMVHCHWPAHMQLLAKWADFTCHVINKKMVNFFLMIERALRMHVYTYILQYI